MQKILFRGDIIHTVCPYYTIHCEYHWYISNVLITQSRSFEKTKQKILTDFEIQILFCSKQDWKSIPNCEQLSLCQDHVCHDYVCHDYLCLSRPKRVKPRKWAILEWKRIPHDTQDQNRCWKLGQRSPIWIYLGLFRDQEFIREG